MALNPPEQLKKLLNREWEEGWNFFVQRVYGAGMDQTLEDADLQLGDYLPGDDSDYEIVGQPSIKYDQGTKSRYIVVTGLLENTVEVGDPWSELVGSRKSQDLRDRKQITMTFTGATDAVRPRRGQTYADLTGTAVTLTGDGVLSEPLVSVVGDVEKATRNLSHVTVTFEWYWSV